MHLLRNNYQLIDADGKPTLWGQWDPGYINSIPHSVGDRKLGSAIIIAGLQLGYTLTGKEIYKSEAFRLMNEYGYLKNTLVSYNEIKSTQGVIHKGVDIGSGDWNHSDDEMAFLTYWVLYHYPMDLVRWNVKNSQRKDIVLLPSNFRNQLTKDLLPPGETPVHRHNANAFALDGGEGGLSELAGDEYLLPYWMARYLKVID